MAIVVGRPGSIKLLRLSGKISKCQVLLCRTVKPIE